MIIPIWRTDFRMAKMWCVCVVVSEWCLHLWAYRRWSRSEVKSREGRLSRLVGCPTGKGEPRGAWRLMLVLSFSSRFSSSEHKSIGSWVNGALSYGGWAFRGIVAQLRMTHRNPELVICTMILKWGLPFSEHRQTGSSPIGDKPFERQLLDWGWAW